MADNKLYKILGVSRNASDAEIRKQYKKLAKEFHPDKNPTAGDKFKEISFAYEILSDPKQRHIYDHYGLKGIQRDNRHDRHHREPSFSDLLDSGFLFNAFRRHPRGNDVNILLSVSLEELYSGTVRKMEHEKVVICTACYGKGCKNGVTLPKCYTCHGTGLTTHARTSSFFGFGFMEHIPTQCPKCGGSGEVITERLKCPTCLGKKIRDEKKVLDIFVEKGMHNNQKIHFRGEGNQMPGEIPGDVTIILQEQSHERFQRSGNNLKLSHTITLTEALCGFEFAIRHLDGRDIIIRNIPGEVIKPGDVKYVMGEGMPIYRHSTERGNLIITFDVVFPPNHFQTPNILAQLEGLLPARPIVQIPTGENVEEVDLEEYDPNSDRGSGYQRYGEAYHSDDEDAHDGAGIRCATQ